MRRKKEAVLSFESNDDGLPKVVRDYRKRYRAISQVLDDNPKILAAVHGDILKLSAGDSQGRNGDYTSENILRALVVQHIEGLPFRDTVIRIGGDGFLQDFLRMQKKAVMDFTFLNKCFLTIEPKTWKWINEHLGQYGVAQGAVNPKVIRGLSRGPGPTTLLSSVPSGVEEVGKQVCVVGQSAFSFSPLLDAATLRGHFVRSCHNRSHPGVCFSAI